MVFLPAEIERSNKTPYIPKYKGRHEEPPEKKPLVVFLKNNKRVYAVYKEGNFHRVMEETSAIEALAKIDSDDVLFWALCNSRIQNMRIDQ